MHYFSLANMLSTAMSKSNRAAFIKKVETAIAENEARKKQSLLDAEQERERLRRARAAAGAGSNLLLSS